MRITAGLLVYCEGKVLLVRQRGTGKYSIPKGEVNKGESRFHAAVRETEEETGIRVNEIDINKTEFLCSIYTDLCQRKLFYYKAFVSVSLMATIRIKDSQEIEDVRFCGLEEAITIIQLSQVAILWDGGRTINTRILNRMVACGWIHVEKHPTEMLYIYNYTERCKKEKAWNELTMWCRGLITDVTGFIVSYPLKKFFEFSQLYPECRFFNEHFEVSEKMDGFLGITYFIDGKPYIATRDSFFSFPAIKATSILYTKHLRDITQMNMNYTYLFEIVFPNDYLILDYGNEEELFLIDIVDNQTGKSIIKNAPSLSFPIITHKPNTNCLDYYLKKNEIGREGLVLKFPDGERLKVKFPWFKDMFIKKNG